MGGEMSKIVPGIYVGGLSAAKSEMQLTKYGITHLCTVVLQYIEVKNRKQIVFRADDSPNERLSRFFEDACFFIHEARVSGGSVLIHCACGVSRSVTITLAYLLVLTDLCLADLFKAVQGARHCACPNSGFMQQLLDFEKSSELTVLREKLFSQFGEWPEDKRKADLEDLNTALKAQEHFILHGVYPGETPLPLARKSCDIPQTTVSDQGKPVFMESPPPIHPLKPSCYTVYCHDDKPRQLSEFLATRTRPLDAVELQPAESNPAPPPSS
ncbi:hypothetical protein EG68_10161 [Paragonimus skrjabini miyazakii]|uniref:Uncharacterized protein n=1 Tax=Paragonimus skrjabini miyazakii TaxID=59628 RepID=A0A8S9YSJ6_9TREM|nr:hypothetical protein EG68_10161 [Paragonimus skrjabini miyazakii]